MSPRATAILSGLFFAVVFVAVAGFLLYGEYQKWRLENDYGETIATMCVTPNDSVASLGNGPRIMKPWRAVVIDGEKKHSVNGMLPAEAQGKDAASTDVVICVNKIGKQVIEECPYRSIDTGQRFIVRRVQYFQNLVVLNAATGDRITTVASVGSAPEECPYRYRGKDDDELLGGKPGDREMYYAVMNAIWR